MGHQEALATIAALTFPGRAVTRVAAYFVGQVDTVFGGLGAASDDWLVDLAHIEEIGPNLQPSPQTLPLSTGGVRVLPGEQARITAAIQDTREFQCHRFFIANSGTAGGAADWMINNISFGARSQFLQAGDIPGDLFATVAIDTFVVFEPVRREMDVIVDVMYVGANENGAPFYGSLVGAFAGETASQYKRLLIPRHDIPAGFACVRPLRNDLGDSEVEIYLPAIDAAVFEVAIDSVLAADGIRTQELDEVIGQSLEGRTGLVLEAYVAAIMQRAEWLISEETKET